MLNYGNKNNKNVVVVDTERNLKDCAFLKFKLGNV